MFRRAVQVVRRGMASGRRIVPLCLSMMFLYQWKSIPKMLTPQPQPQPNHHLPPPTTPIEPQQHQPDFPSKTVIVYLKDRSLTHDPIQKALYTYAKNNPDLVDVYIQQVDKKVDNLLIQRKYSSSSNKLKLPLNNTKQQIDEFLKNIQKFNDELPVLRDVRDLKPKHSSELTFVMFVDRSSGRYPRNVNRFLELEGKVGRNRGRFVLVEDVGVARELGLGEVEAGRVGLIVPTKHKHLRKNKPSEITIAENKYVVIQNAQNVEEVSKAFVYLPYLPEKKDYTLQVILDRNAFQSQIQKYLQRQLSQLESPYPMLYTPKSTKQGYQILLKKSDSELYKFDLPLSKSNLTTWLQRVASGLEPRYYPSQKTKPYDVHSHKFTSSSFHKILSSERDELVYMYNSHCSGCKKVGPIFEKLAGMWKGNPYLGWNRINTEKNTIKQGFNFNYTPVLLYFKHGVKKPFEYRRGYITPKMLQDFVEVCGEVRVIGEEPVLEEIRRRERELR